MLHWLDSSQPHSKWTWKRTSQKHCTSAVYHKNQVKIHYNDLNNKYKNNNHKTATYAAYRQTIAAQRACILCQFVLINSSIKIIITENTWHGGNWEGATLGLPNYWRYIVVPRNSIVILAKSSVSELHMQQKFFTFSPSNLTNFQRDSFPTKLSVCSSDGNLQFHI